MADCPTACQIAPEIATATLDQQLTVIAACHTEDMKSRVCLSARKEALARAIKNCKE